MNKFIEIFKEQNALLTASFFGDKETFDTHAMPKLLDAIVFITPFALLGGIASFVYEVLTAHDIMAGALMGGFILVLVFVFQAIGYYMNKWKASFIARLWGAQTIVQIDGTQTNERRLNKTDVRKFYVSFGYIELLWSLVNICLVFLFATADSLHDALSAMGIVLALYGLVRFCKVIPDAQTTKYTRRVVAVIAGNILFSLVVFLGMILLILAGLGIGTVVTGENMFSAEFWQQALTFPIE